MYRLCVIVCGLFDCWVGVELCGWVGAKVGVAAEVRGSCRARLPVRSRCPVSFGRLGLRIESIQYDAARGGLREQARPDSKPYPVRRPHPLLRLPLLPLSLHELVTARRVVLTAVAVGVGLLGPGLAVLLELLSELGDVVGGQAEGGGRAADRHWAEAVGREAGSDGDVSGGLNGRVYWLLGEGVDLSWQLVGLPNPEGVGWPRGNRALQPDRNLSQAPAKRVPAGGGLSARDN